MTTPYQCPDCGATLRTHLCTPLAQARHRHPAGSRRPALVPARMPRLDDEPHRFHDPGDCFPGCPAWRYPDGPMCLRPDIREEGEGVCWRELVAGVCPVHGSPEAVARVLAQVEEELATSWPDD